MDLAIAVLILGGVRICFDVAVRICGGVGNICERSRFGLEREKLVDSFIKRPFAF